MFKKGTGVSTVAAFQATNHMVVNVICFHDTVVIEAKPIHSAFSARKKTKHYQHPKTAENDQKKVSLYQGLS